jgi:phage virion morphogenesis protein
MAGAQNSITIDDENVKRSLQKLAAQSLDLKKPFQEIGASLVTSTKQRFQDKESPDGDAWQAVSPAYALTKLKGSKQNRIGPRDPADILVRSGHLRNFISYLAERFELAVGSNQPYAAIHQLGGTDDMAAGPAGIPARPYLGVSDDDQEEIAQILLEHLAAA